MTQGGAADAQFLALVTELEALTFDPAGADLEPLVEDLTRRQRILDALAETDTTQLAAETRRTARARMEAVQRRDAAALAALASRRAEILESLEDSGRAREAARGYRAAAADERTPSRGAL